MFNGESLSRTASEKNVNKARKIACFSMAKRNKQSPISFHNGSAKGIINFSLICDAWLSLSTPLLTLSSIQCQAYIIDVHACLHDFWNIFAFVNSSSETSLKKLSQLNGLLNNGKRLGNLHHIRKHQSHLAVPLRWLARNFFSSQSEAGNSKASGIGLVRVSAQGLISILQ